MAEKKKRGLFSWLGFGSEEKSEHSEQTTEINSVIEGQDESPKSQISDAKDAEIAHNDDAKNDAADSAKDTVTEPVAKAEPEAEASISQLEAVEEQVELASINADAASDDAQIEAEIVSEQLQAKESAEHLCNEETENNAELESPVIAIAEQEKPKSEGFFARLMRGLRKTKENFGSSFFSLFKGKKIDDELFEELEEQLLIADVGMDTTVKIIENLTEKASRKELKDGEALYGLLKDELAEMLAKVEQPFEIDTSKKPYVILMVGVNGVGKTTTIGKLAKKFQSEGKSVMLAAGDTFRAAAVEQLQVWGERNQVPVIAQHTGADSASVIFDAIESAKAKNIDVIIADTAGRLQNKANLMEELRKIVRVMKKIDPDAPHEIMLTLDAGTGQNAISQAKLFSEVAPVSGITLTKLDGTAKGGVIFAIADQFHIPIRYIGIGEGIDDLRPFAADEFIEALFTDEE
ncbi:Signal recognition particle receptor FtsY [Photobacterium damselae subsp. damselae]|uniref:signal recognition particle-docking protein FtsY n=1 Tax=Photobacterium damselae TaxID=38293 RepID=UPI00109BDBC2|nr:signal recognition particle-docking protein FtsY [Photobacterium damselae]TGZ34586.1 Signal recognition particle receptor FtsY [Photobacterium damselae subsp. damselae]